jgi:hypothetical protein
MLSGFLLYNLYSQEEAKELNIQRGQQVAHKFIEDGFLWIEIGQGQEWRPIFERLLTERYGVRFPPQKYQSFCMNMTADEDLIESAESVMRDEVTKRFKPGLLEQIAQEAKNIHEAEQAAPRNR